MNLEKAIEILKDHQMEYAKELDADTLNSIQLGIEALKRIHNARVDGTLASTNPLPGETED